MSTIAPQPAAVSTPAAASTPAAVSTPGPASSPAPTPAGTGTPVKTDSVNGVGGGTRSRATSLMPPDASEKNGAGPAFPSEAGPNGAPARQYLNAYVVPSLMEGMKMVAKER